MSAEALTSVPAAGLAAGRRAVGVRRLFGMPCGGPNLDMIGAAAVAPAAAALTLGPPASAVHLGFDPGMVGARLHPHSRRGSTTSRSIRRWTWRAHQTAPEL